MNRSIPLNSALVLALSASVCGCGAEDTGDSGQTVMGPYGTAGVMAPTPTAPVGTTGEPTATGSPVAAMPAVPPPTGSPVVNPSPAPGDPVVNPTPTPAVDASGNPVAVPTPTPTPVPVDPNNPTPTPVVTPEDPGPTPVVTPTPVDPVDPGPMPVDPVDPAPTPVASGDCVFTVEHELSEAIGTVGIVNWSATGITVESAEIEFGLAGGDSTMVAPVDLAEANYRTLLLGMKGDQDYVFRIVATGGGQTCVSEDFMLTTDPVPNAVTQVEAEIMNPATASKGFVITTAGIGNLGGGGGGGGGGGATPMLIFDTDGDIVWWADAPGSSSRAHMDWAGKNMYVGTLNYPQGSGQMRRISMDGTDTETIAALSNVHHDFTVTPEGLAVIMYEGSCSGIFEYTPGGGTTPIVNSIDTLYQPGGGMMGGSECHPNAITYQAADDTFVVGDRNPNLFVRISRTGELMWQFGGGNPMGNHLTGSWSVNHGHHLLPNGNMLFFNNANGNPSPVLEYSLDTTSWQASEVWNFTLNGSGSVVLGDVQRLANGNTLVTYSNSGTVVEVDPQDTVVARFTLGSMGYSMFRETLYGPPPK